jgi:hypothetical protein
MEGGRQWDEMECEKRGNAREFGYIKSVETIA